MATSNNLPLAVMEYKLYIFKEKDRIVRLEMKRSDTTPIKKKSKLILAFDNAINIYKNGQGNEKYYLQ